MKRWLLAACALVAGLSGSQAQLRLTLDEALEIALSENPTIRIVGFSLKIGRAHV